MLPSSIKHTCLLVALAALAACSAHVDPGRTTMHLPGATITTGGAGSGHCPPGHAKKGWC